MSMAIEHQIDLIGTFAIRVRTDRIRHKCLVEEAYNQLRDNPERFIMKRLVNLSKKGCRVRYCKPLADGKQWVLIWHSPKGVLRTFAVEKVGKHWERIPWHFARSLRDDILSELAIEALCKAEPLFEGNGKSRLIEQLAERCVTRIKEGESPERAARNEIKELVNKCA